MSKNVDIKNLKRFQKKIEKIEQNSKSEFDKIRTIILNKKFMNQHTNFDSFDELLTFGGYIVNSEEDFLAIPDNEFDSFIVENTDFPNWQTMLDTAYSKYLKSCLR
ncbi:TPA: hypothetical protein SHW33_002081 [Clostridioides difficile]|uniref:hypothetical protein n=1 Tax=Clostridioides difficile TaxID=1496 RepID=UPI000938A28C|nr:hypothetical protein [Clostridioides difficile]QVW56648.1 hypothetical protein [Clostridioides phage CD1801]EGT3685956.1 hypothetical protein [Clostridioides difficile]EGT3850349.1 hypothetical protein [Clostridioides difficile]EGT4521470.1 hypothetical protein [Clostridioides difficile]EKG0757304.1 hypothetical protein [Clostridioides difficile]